MVALLMRIIERPGEGVQTGATSWFPGLSPTGTGSGSCRAFRHGTRKWSRRHAEGLTLFL